MTQLLRNGLKASWKYSVQRSIGLPLALLFGLSLWLVSPVGEFPLNDDWIYTKTVQHLLETGQYQAHPYLNATLVVQAYWGALCCKLFGFSFTTLRCSTLVLAWLNAWAVAQCALAIGLTRKLALLCAAVIATSPLVLQLSYSFMTDVPFLTFSSLSGLCFLKAMAKPQQKWVALGSGCAVLAFGVRQFGILLPLAFAIAAVRLAWQRQYTIPRSLTLALLLPWSVAVGLYLGWGKALTSNTPILEPITFLDGPLMDGLRHIPVALCYIGLFTLPLGLGRFWQLFHSVESWTKCQWRRFGVFCSISLLLFSLPQGLAHLKRFLLHEGSVWLERYPARMPLMVYRTLLDLGLGPLQLPDPQPKTIIQIQEGWWPITLLALGVSGILFVSTLDRWFGTSSKLSHTAQGAIAQRQDLFLTVWGTLTLAAAYNPFRAVTLDRYFLPALVPFMLLLARDVGRYRQSIAWKPMILGIIAIALFSLASLQDYLGWNRTAWAAHRHLEAVDNVSPQAVRGIDTFSGWYNSDTYMARYKSESWWDMDLGHKGAWVLDDQYMVATMALRPGYRILDRFPYFSWLGWRQRTIATFKRIDAADGITAQ